MRRRRDPEQANLILLEPNEEELERETLKQAIAEIQRLLKDLRPGWQPNRPITSEGDH